MNKYIIDTNILVGAMGNFYDAEKPISDNSKIVLGGLLELYQPVYPKSLAREYLYILKEKKTQ